jgi:putative tryptophan/tyrosine transport system substrate-binding protein
VRRREFIALLGGTAAWPFAVHAQQQPKKVLGMLWLGTPTSPTVQTFLKGLRDLGWIEGQNILFEPRWASSTDSLPEMAAQATNTIPIVFGNHGDPVGSGHVVSLAHPGGNITGISNQVAEFGEKGLEVLREAIPNVTRFGLLWDPTSPAGRVATPKVEAAAEKLGIQLHIANVRSTEEFDGALATIAHAGIGAFFGATSPLTYNHRVRLVEVALSHRLAGIFSSREMTEAGALMSYAPNFLDLHRRAAGYVDKILRGAKPANLAIEQPTKFELVINLKNRQGARPYNSTLTARPR